MYIYIYIFVCIYCNTTDSDVIFSFVRDSYDCFMRAKLFARRGLVRNSLRIEP